MSKTRIAIILLLGVTVATGCGGGSGSSKPTISVSVSPSAAQTIDEGQQIQLTATVANDSGTKGVTWTMTGQGSLSGQTTTVATYSAPGSATGTATVTATSVTDSTKSASTSITVTAAPTITTASLPPGTVGAAYNQTVTASGGAGTLTFSISAGSLTPGLTLSSAGAITGTAAGAGIANFTVRVTDSSTAGAQSATKLLSIMTSAAPLAIATTTLLNGIQNDHYKQALRATGGTSPLTWSITSGALPAGLLLDGTTGAISGTPTATGVSSFTVQAADASVPVQTASQLLTITTEALSCGSGSESLLNGQYGFELLGSDSSGPAAILGSFTADGTGKITVGEEDINTTGGGGPQLGLSVVATPSSSYSIGSDQRGCLTLVTSVGTRVFRFSLSSITGGIAAKGRVIEFDDLSINLSGAIHSQTASTMITGSYAFGGSSPQLIAGVAGRYAIVGGLTITGASVTGLADTNLNGTVTSISSLSGNISTIDSNGRGTLSFTPNGGTAVNTVIYVWTSSEFVILSSDPQSATKPLFRTTALQQVGAPYGNLSLNATGLIFLSGLAASTVGSVADVGYFTPDGSGNFSFSGDRNSGGTLNTLSLSGSGSGSGFYSIAASGRGTLNNSGGVWDYGISVPAAASDFPDLVVYLNGPNAGFYLSTDSHVLEGMEEPVNGGPFSNNSLNGTFSLGSIDPADAGNTVRTGVVAFDGSGTLSGTLDVNATGFLSLGNALSPTTYSVESSGRGTLPASGTPQILIYVISPAKAVLFDYQSTSPEPILQVVER
jgi:hypothetical protein